MSKLSFDALWLVQHAPQKSDALGALRISGPSPTILRWSAAGHLWPGPPARGQRSRIDTCLSLYVPPKSCQTTHDAPAQWAFSKIPIRRDVRYISPRTNPLFGLVATSPCGAPYHLLIPHPSNSPHPPPPPPLLLLSSSTTYQMFFGRKQEGRQWET